MKKSIVGGAAAIILGLLIALGPIFIFKACSADCCSDYPECLWSVQMEIGLGIVIAALGICLILYPDKKTQLGLVIGILVTGLFALLIPNVIIGGCEDRTMACHVLTFPILTVLSSLVMAGSAVYLFTLRE